MKMTKHLVTSCACLLAASLCIAPQSRAEDGYELWLRYKPVEMRRLEASRESTTEIVAGSPSPVLTTALRELTRGLLGLLGTSPAIASTVTKDGSIIVGTPRSLPIIGQLEVKWDELGTEGYVIHSLTYEGHPTILIAANSDIGVLYGTFAFLRLLQTRQSLQNVQVLSAPHVRYRILDHWDNLDRGVERGYAGESIAISITRGRVHRSVSTARFQTTSTPARSA
jgi:alpha-glucuronidase